jgi:hypothetical protein
MSDEIEHLVPETVQEQPASDLRSVLNAALEKQTGAPVEASSEPVVEQVKDERPREADGKFKAVEKATEKPVEASAKPVEAKAPEGAQPAPDAPLRPPIGWTAPAKAEFDRLPQVVKDAIAKREADVNTGLARLQVYKPLDPYIENCEKNNTTLHDALGRYTTIEKMFRQDPVMGLGEVCKNMGLSPRVIYQELGRRLGINQLAGQPQQAPQAQLPDAFLQQFQHLNQKFSSWEQERQQQEQNQRASTVSEFFTSADHPYAENVAEEMAELIKLDKSNRSLTDKLKSAYDKATWSNPEVRALLIKQQATPQSASEAAKASASKARQAAKATVGAPGNGYSPSAAPTQSKSIGDTIRQAVSAHSGRA